MSRIISYPYDNIVTDEDAWVGSDADSGKTKQYTAAAVAEYLNVNGKISIGSAMLYQYTASSLSGTGTMALESGGGVTPFADVTSLTLSTNDRSGLNTTAFVDYLVGSDILINEQKNLLAFGHYTVDSYTAVSADYYTINVTFNGGQGRLTPTVIYNLDNFFLGADVVGDLNFTFTQASAQSVWNITHNLGKFPSVSIIDSAGTNVIGQVDYINNNELTLTFTAAFAGVAYLN